MRCAAAARDDVVEDGARNVAVAVAGVEKDGAVVARDATTGGAETDAEDVRHRRPSPQVLAARRRSQVKATSPKNLLSSVEEDVRPLLAAASPVVETRLVAAEAQVLHPCYSSRTPVAAGVGVQTHTSTKAAVLDSAERTS